MSSTAVRSRVGHLCGVLRRRELSPLAFRRVTVVSLAVMVLIIVSGAAVRLTGSGLACPNWPDCTAHGFVAPLAINPWIEFGNRLINGAITIIAVVAVIAARVRVGRRRDLFWLSMGLVGGVLAECVLGGITVLEKLPPQLVSAHFLLAGVLLVDALVLHHRAGIPDDEIARPGRLTVSRPQLWWSRLLLLATAVVIFLGTVVTSTGPHGGSPQARRYHLSLHHVAQMHGSSVEVFVGLTVVMCWWLARSGAPRAVLRRAEVLLAVVIVQGIIGYVQYATGVPAGLVEVHVAGSVAVMVAVTRFHLGLTVRAPAARPAAAPLAIDAPLVGA